MSIINFNARSSSESSVPSANVSVAASPVTDLSWDQSACIRRATGDYLESLSRPITLSNSELRDGCMIAIKDAIVERNVVQGNKVAIPQKLVNTSIGDLILAKYEVRSFSWTGDSNDGFMVAIYQESGPNAGIYDGSFTLFRRLVNDFEYTATHSDVKEVISYLEANAKNACESKHPDLIAFNNGILDYKTKQLMPFSPDICLLAKSSVDYPTNPPLNPHITMPDGVTWDFDSWIESLSEDPDIVDLLLKICGAILRPNVRWDHAICLSGKEGMNGKGTFCQLLRNLCGDNRYVSLELRDFSKDSMVAKLMFAIAVITDENDTKSTAKGLSRFKAAVTGDSITIDRKYMSAITFRFSGLIVQCLNSLPRTDDTTESLYRRFIMVPFDKTFKNVERKYIKSDYLHRPDVLEYVAWKVMNIPDYYKLPEPNACKELLGMYKEFNDPVLEFVNTVFPEFSWEKVPQSFIVDLYYKWAQKNSPSGRTIGSRELSEKIREIVQSIFSNEWIFANNEVRINKNDNKAPELMICEYGLDDWRSKSYKGTDPNKMSMPTFKEKYRNVYIKI